MFFAAFLSSIQSQRSFSEDGSFNEGRWRGCLAVAGTATGYL
jgi:hypothetical protein